MLAPAERDEICATVEALRGELDDLAVRGVRAAGPDDLRSLDGARAELARVGASHLAERTGGLLDAIRADAPDAAARLMRAQTSLRVFERVLTLDHVAGLFEEEPEEEAPKPKARKAKATAVGSTPPAPPPPLTLEEGRKLLPALDDLVRTACDLVAAGLTTATEATRQKLDVSMKEALRLKLGRLGAALRFVNEEIGRFLAHDEGFSGRRFAFFLNRAWLVAHGLGRAIRAGDAAALGRLLLSPPATPVKRLELCSLGAGKRVVRSTSSCAFELRLRALADAPPVKAGTRLVWSCLFSYTGSFPPEAFLHLPQPQKFLPRVFTEAAPIVVENAAVALDETGGGRLMLGPQSTVVPGRGKVKWAQWLAFDRRAAAARLRAHRPGPLDIEVELQEEIVLREWEAGAPAPRPGRADQLVYPVRGDGLELDAVVPAGDDGAELRAALDALRAEGVERPPLFGLVHYELCRLILQPLAVMEDEGPRHLMISSEHHFDPNTLADLTRALMSKR